MATSIIPQTQGVISVERVLVYSKATISKTSYVEVSSDPTQNPIAKSGYKVLGIASVNIEGNTTVSSSGASYVFIFKWSYDEQTDVLSCGMRSIRDSTAYVDVYAIVIYEKL